MTGKGRPLRVLALEPYFGGSHQSFLEGWQAHSRHEWTTLTLPAHKWKWRMRQSAMLFAWEIERRFANGERWDVVFASDMLNLAEFLGLARVELASVPSVLYFHENQITYPVRVEKERDLHFGVSNLVSGAAASAVWFNSEFHRRSFLEAAPAFLERVPDHRPREAVERIAQHSVVQHPGIDDPGLGAESARSGPLQLVWAARWEHDKDPDSFFDALRRLQACGVDFRLSVLGQRFRESPPVFESARADLGHRVLRWGYLSSRSEYEEELRRADVFVSTARHEFFGLAAVEAIAAGAEPLLPTRLSYPELLGAVSDPDAASCLYGQEAAELSAALRELSWRKENGTMRRRGFLRERVERFFWPIAGQRLDAALEAIVV